MTFYRIEVEVAGGLGPDINYDPELAEPLVGHLHYEFQGWLGDEIVETAGYWIVTPRLAQALRAAGLSGWSLEPTVTTKEAQYDLLPHRYEMPTVWERLVPTGKAGVDDLGLEGRTGLIISEAALALLRAHRISDAQISPVDQPATVPDVMQRYLQRKTERELAASVPSEASVPSGSPARGAGRGVENDRCRATAVGPVAIAGEVMTFFNALGAERGDNKVAAALALVGSMEIGEPYREDGAKYSLDVSVAGGTSFTWKNDRLLKVIFHLRNERGSRPYPRPTQLLQGFGPDSSREQFRNMLGDPSAEKPGGDRWNVGSHFLFVSFAGDRVQRIGAMISPR